MSNTTAKAIIYCRVSSKTQEQDGHGLESQEVRCRQFAVSKGLEVAAVFPDTMTGGGDFMARPGMVALLSFIDAQPHERFVVIFDDLKRASRDTRAFLDLRDAFRLRRVQVECLNFKFDDTPEGEFIETIMAAQGALERKQNGRQVAQKMKARMQSGFWIHNAPAGYKYETVKGRGKMLFFDDPLATIVRDAFEGYAMGRFETQAEIQRFFETFPDFPRNKKGEITRQRVKDILTNPLYTGYICSENYGISWLKGHHDALIAVETYDKVQARLQGIARAPQRKNIGNDLHYAALCAAPIAARPCARRTAQVAVNPTLTTSARPNPVTATANPSRVTSWKAMSVRWSKPCNHQNNSSHWPRRCSATPGISGSHRRKTPSALARLRSKLLKNK